MIGKTNVNGTSDASGVGAVLSIDAPIGSTVTVSQGSFSKVLRNSIEINAYFSRYFYFIKPNKFGSWTITATDGTDTVSKVISVIENKEYDVGPMCYPLVLYDSGNQYVDVTGGWEFKPYSSSSAAGVTFGETDIIISPANQYSTCVGTISMSGDEIAPFSTLKAELQVLSTGGDSRVGIVPNYNLGGSGIDNKWTVVAIYTTTGTFTASVNISALSTGYVLLTSWKQNAKFSKVWLEP